MADRTAEDADLALDEVKRKARRRLVGAIVLALAAAIILPMLLEKEPRPLGDDVAVQIPPVDEGKFVNRLTGKAGDARPLPKAENKADSKAGAGKSDAKAEDAAPGAVAPGNAAAAAPQGGETLVPKKSVAEAEQRALLPPARTSAKADAKPASAPDEKGATKPATAESKSAPKAAAAPPKAETAPADAKGATEATAVAKSAPADAAPAASASAPPAANAAPAKADGFVVQLAAFADDKGANALANKLKKGGYAAYVEPVQTSRGTLWRVRVGGYASRPDADAARAKLRGEGYSGIVAAAK